MERPKFKAAFDTSGLIPNLEELKSANLFFINKLALRSKSDADDKELEKVLEARKSTKLVFDQLVNYLNAISLIDESQELKNLGNGIADLINKANSTIHARITRNTKGNGLSDDELLNDSEEQLDDETDTSQS